MDTTQITPRKAAQKQVTDILYTTFNTLIGMVTVATDTTHITALHIEGDRYFTKVPNHWIQDPRQPLLLQAQRELEEYFDGKRRQFDVPVAAKGTAFQTIVWGTLQKIPFGTTTSYGAIAQNIGRPAAIRAVGTAIGHNPICIIIPCHRVRGSTGSLGGYVAGLLCKQNLLAVEARAATVQY